MNKYVKAVGIATILLIPYSESMATVAFSQVIITLHCMPNGVNTTPATPYTACWGSTPLTYPVTGLNVALNNNARTFVSSVPSYNWGSILVQCNPGLAVPSGYKMAVSIARQYNKTTGAPIGAICTYGLAPGATGLIQ